MVLHCRAIDERLRRLAVVRGNGGDLPVRILRMQRVLVEPRRGRGAAGQHVGDPTLHLGPDEFLRFSPVFSGLTEGLREVDSGRVGEVVLLRLGHQFAPEFERVALAIGAALLECGRGNPPLRFELCHERLHPLFSGIPRSGCVRHGTQATRP